MAKAHSSIALNTPRLFDKMNELMIDSMQNAGEPAKTNRPDGLYEPNSKLRERGAKDRFVLEKSVYQRAKIHPLLTTALAIGGGAAIAALVGSLKPKSDGDGKRLRGGDYKIHSFDIRKDMEVVGSDGSRVGTVDGVEYGEIKLTRKDSMDGQHHFIPTDSVESIDGNKVMLSQTAEQARQTWRSGDGETNNRLSEKNAGKSAGQIDALSKTSGGSM